MQHHNGWIWAWRGGEGEETRQVGAVFTCELNSFFCTHMCMK